MKLWIRYRNPAALCRDEIVTLSDPKEWYELVNDPEIVSSILWPDEPVFSIESRYFNRRHPHEKDYLYDRSINLSYRHACEELAGQIIRRYAGINCLIYAPMRGAYPIWKTISQFVGSLSHEVYFPVTSSFVFYSEQSGIVNRKGRPASGRYNHTLELLRIRPFLHLFDVLIYVDEIISGSMMFGYLKDMIRLKIHMQIPLVAVGLADSFGSRSDHNRKRIQNLKDKGIISDFLCEGCNCLITEDQKFLLGIHYADYHSGMNIIPVFNEDMNFFEEKVLFDQDVLDNNLTVPLR